MSLELKKVLGQVNNIAFIVNENFDRIKNLVMLKDGSVPMTGDLDMAQHRILNIGGLDLAFENIDFSILKHVTGSLDEVTESGMYSIDNSVPDRPLGTDDGVMIVMKRDYQTLIQFLSGTLDDKRFYFRTATLTEQGTWEFTEWVEFLHTNKITISESEPYGGTHKDLWFQVGVVGTAPTPEPEEPTPEPEEPEPDFGDTIYFGFEDGTIKCVTASLANDVWEIKRTQVSDICVLDGIYIHCDNGYVEKLDATGNRLWRALNGNDSNAINYKKVLSGYTQYYPRTFSMIFTKSGDYMYSLYGDSTISNTWTLPELQNAISVQYAQKVPTYGQVVMGIFVLDTEGYLTKYNYLPIVDHEIAWRVKIGNGGAALYAGEDPARNYNSILAFVGTNDGKLTRVDNGGNIVWTYNLPGTPTDIVADSYNEFVYVGLYNKILKLTYTGSLVTEFNWDGYRLKTDIYQNIYAASSSSGRVVKLDVNGYVRWSAELHSSIVTCIA